MPFPDGSGYPCTVSREIKVKLFCGSACLCVPGLFREAKMVLLVSNFTMT